MAQNHKPLRVRVNEGEQDGIIVVNEQEKQRYIIDMPNAYDVYWQFLNKAGEPDFARKVEHPDPSGKRVAFEVSWDNLMSEQAIRLLNHKVVAARNVNSEIVQERKDFEDILAFDLAKPEKKAVILYGRPKQSNFHMGEVVRTGKYYVAIASEGTDAVYCRIIHGGKFLNGKDDYARRGEVLAEKFPVGSYKRLNWNKDGTVSINDYVPRYTQQAEQPAPTAPQPEVKVDVKPVDHVQPPPAVAEQPKPIDKPVQESQAQPSQPQKLELSKEQKEALIAFREANLPTWKMALGKAWTSGNYGSMTTDQAAYLQQVRNQFGPEWLQRVRPDDLTNSPEATAKKLMEKVKPQPSKVKAPII